MIWYFITYYATPFCFQILTYIIFSLGIHRLLAASGLASGLSIGQRTSISILFGPIAGAWVYGAVLRVMPGQEAGTYIAAVGGIWAAIALTGTNVLRSELHLFYSAARSWISFETRRFTKYIFAMIFFLTILSLIWVITWVPIYANDPLEYLKVSTLITDQRALIGVYPALNTSISSGFYGPWTHPPGFVLMISWAQLLQSSPEIIGSVKFINVYALAASVLVIFIFAGGIKRYRGFIAAGFYLLTPILISQTFESHVDIYRIGLWTGAFLTVPAWAKRPTLPASLALGVMFGLGHFIHSIGLIALPIFAVLGAIIAAASLPRRVIGIVLVIFAAMAVVAPDLMNNYRNFGRVIGDRAPLWDIEKLDVAKHLAYDRGINTPWEVLANGVLAQFTRTTLFGVSPFFMLLGCAFALILWFAKKGFKPRQILRHAVRPSLLSVSAYVWLGFFGITVLSALAGLDLIVKNARYGLTTIGTVGILAALFWDFNYRVLRRWIGNFEVTLTSTDHSSLRSAAGWNSHLKFMPARLRRWSKWMFLAAPSIVAAVTLVAFFSLVSSTGLRVMNLAAFDETTAARSDQLKISMMNHPQFRLIGRLNRKFASGEWIPAGKVLTFRVGDLAQYAKFAYASYLDPALLAAFSAPDAKSAAAALRAETISHVLVPAYSLAEIYNSAIGDLLSDPSMVRIADSDSGYTLYEILDLPAVTQAKLVGRSFALQVPDAFTSTYTETPTARLINGWSGRFSAYFVGEPFDTRNGEHRLDTTMSGSGFAQIALTRDNKVVQSIWEGLVPHDRTRRAFLFDIAELDFDFGKTNAGPESRFRLAIWLKPGSSLSLHSASLVRIQERESTEVKRVDTLNLLHRRGYDFTVSNFPQEFLEIEPEAGGYSALNLDGRSLLSSFPKYVTASNLFEDHLMPEGRLKATATLGGAGLRTFHTEIQCHNPDALEPEAFATAKVFEREYLNSGPSQDYSLVADVPCALKTAQFSVEMMQPIICKLFGGKCFEWGQSPLRYHFGKLAMESGYVDQKNAWQWRVMEPLSHEPK